MEQPFNIGPDLPVQVHHYPPGPRFVEAGISWTPISGKAAAWLLTTQDFIYRRLKLLFPPI